MADVSMPSEIVQFMRDQNWGTHHIHWHLVRVWDLVDDAARAWATDQGWSRYDVQEGEEGNGLEFLAMHRVMVRMLLDRFPAHSSLFDGWSTVPTDPADPQDPLPNGATTPFHPNYTTALDRLENDLDTFDGEDLFGTYIETTLRPFPNDPDRRASDNSSGIHNYLHNRFADPDSDINMGNPTVNIENERFWRLHGWIDARWTAYRTASGRSETDPRYLKALEDAEAHMSVPTPDGELALLVTDDEHHHHPTHPVEVPPHVLQSILDVLYTCDVE